MSNAKLTVAVAALALVAAIAQAQAQTKAGTVTSRVKGGDPALGKLVAQRACNAYHGADGIGVAGEFPNLAGQKRGYMYQTLIRMRSAARARAGAAEDARAKRAKTHRRLAKTRRSNAAMDPFVVDLSDADLANVAAYYAGLPCRLRSASATAAPAVAARCKACHGATGVSRNRMFPNLAGQKPTYLRAQILAFRNGKHDTDPTTGRRNPIMSAQVRQLSDLEIDQLVRFFSSQACR